MAYPGLDESNIQTSDGFPPGSVEMRQIPGQPGYFATIDGDIWSAHAGRNLKAYACGPRKYLAFRPRFRGSNIYVHRAVAEAWLGPRPEGLQTRHLNGNNLDNRPSNLAYGTVKENAQDRMAHGTTHRGKRFFSREKELRLQGIITQRKRLGLSVSSIARLAGVSWWSANVAMAAGGVRPSVTKRTS